MSSRSVATLGDVAEFINGAAFRPDDWADCGHPIIRIQNLTDPSKPYNRTARIVSKKLLVQPGDILVSWSATLGVFEWQSDEVGALNQHIFRVVPDLTLIDKRYLRHVLEGALTDIKRHLHGATMQHVNRREFLGTTVFLPAIAEQRRIADILDRADALRAKRREALTHLDDLTQSIFDDMFRHSTDSYPSAPLADAFWFQEGPGVRKWQFRDEGIKLLNVGNILRSGQLDLSATDRHLDPAEVAQKYSHFLADDGDFVIASSGISFDIDGLLRTRGAFVDPSHLPLCMNTSTIRFKAIDERGDLRYLKAWLNSSEFRRQITRLVTGSAQQNFGPSHLKAIHLTLPPPDQQREFARRITRVESLRETQHEYVAAQDALFLSLQQRAFSGQL